MPAEASPTTIGIVLGLISTAMGILWRSFNANIKRSEDRLAKELDECEEKHGKASAVVTELSGRVCTLEANIECQEDRQLTRKLALKALEVLGK